MASIEEEDDEEEEDTVWKQWRCLLTVLEGKISSSSQRIAALLEASDELGKYHAYILWSYIQCYQGFSSKLRISENVWP